MPNRHPGLSLLAQCRSRIEEAERATKEPILIAGGRGE